MGANTLNSWKEDPVVSYLFALTVDNYKSTLAVFSNVSGLSEENTPVFYRQRGAKGELLIKKVPGQYSWGDITLKRGVTTDKSMWAWRQLVVDGNLQKARSTGSIVVYSTDLSKAVATWNFKNAWPSKWSAGALAADSDEVFAEELVLVHEGLTWGGGAS